MGIDTDEIRKELDDNTLSDEDCGMTLREALDEIDSLEKCRVGLIEKNRKLRYQPDVAEALRVWLEEYGIETPEGGYALNLPYIGPAIRKLRKQAIDSVEVNHGD